MMHALTPCVCMYVCMYVCAYVCMYVCLSVCRYMYNIIQYIHAHTHTERETHTHAHPVQLKRLEIRREETVDGLRANQVHEQPEPWRRKIHSSRDLVCMCTYQRPRLPYVSIQRMLVCMYTRLKMPGGT